MLYVLKEGTFFMITQKLDTLQTQGVINLTLQHKVLT